MRKAIYILSLFMVTVPLVVGCGGGDTPALSKLEFIKQGDAICATADKKQSLALESYAKNNSADLSKVATQESVILALGLPPVQIAVEELADLGTPSGDEDRIDAIIEGIEEAIKRTEDDPLSVSRGAGHFTAANKLAREYGFKACADAF